jgi:16S rRNA (uracil1498-N3)-methyltransferase
MRHLFRFIGQQLDPRTWELSDDESHHLSKVLRLSQGEIVEVTNGQGLWATGTVESVGKSTTTLRVTTNELGEAKVHRDPRPKPEIILGVGALRHGTLDEILPGLVELGVDSLHLFHQPGSAKDRLTDKTVARWERLIAQAVKQCKRSWLPVLNTHDSLAALLQSLDITKESSGFFLTPSGTRTLLEGLEQISPLPPSKIILVVGGEQGLSSSEEDQLAKAQFQGVRLGNHVLRAVTAAVSATAVASCHRDRRKSEIVLE